MIIDTNSIISLKNTRNNFTEAADIADHDGYACIFKNNRPFFFLINLSKYDFEKKIPSSITKYNVTHFVRHMGDCLNNIEYEQIIILSKRNKDKYLIIEAGYYDCIVVSLYDNQEDIKFCLDYISENRKEVNVIHNNEEKYYA